MSYEHLKIGKLVQTVLKPLIISKATKQEISKMQELEYSKATFGIQYPLLLKTTSAVAEKHYYSDLFTINGETYRLCCEWYETEKNNDRPYVEKWIKEHETKVATFADVVMEEPEYIASSSKEIKSNKLNQKSTLSGILKTLDPVAFHSEYYKHTVYGNNGLKTAINGKWIFRLGNTIHDDDYIMDENGQNKVYLGLKKRYYDTWNKEITLYGMNNKGIWFGIAEDINESVYSAFICFNPETGNEKIILCNAFKYKIRQVYIYENTIYYIGYKEGVGENLVKIDSCGIETVLYKIYEFGTKEVLVEVGSGSFGTDKILDSTTSKTLHFDSLCADANRVAFSVLNDSGDYWYIMDGTKTVFLSKNKKECYSSDFIEIIVVDLKNNIVWTTISDSECWKYHACKNDLVARNLEKLIIGDYSLQKPLSTFGNASSFCYYSLSYFDGKNLYYSDDYTHLFRYDKFAEKYFLGGCGHGMCGSFLVSEKFLFINYDSFAISRLPRNFSNNHSLMSYENPEVSFLFGKDNLGTL